MGMQEEDEAPQARRTLQQFVNDPVILSFALAPQPDAETGPRQQPATSSQGRSLLRGGSGNGLGEGLPPNVHLLTLMALEHGDVLLRLAHLYQVGFGHLPDALWCHLWASCLLKQTPSLKDCKFLATTPFRLLTATWPIWLCST